MLNGSKMTLQLGGKTPNVNFVYHISFFVQESTTIIKHGNIFLIRSTNCLPFAGTCVQPRFLVRYSLFKWQHFVCFVYVLELFWWCGIFGFYFILCLVPNFACVWIVHSVPSNAYLHNTGAVKLFIIWL